MFCNTFPIFISIIFVIHCTQFQYGNRIVSSISAKKSIVVRSGQLGGQEIVLVAKVLVITDSRVLIQNYCQFIRSIYIKAVASDVFYFYIPVFQFYTVAYLISVFFTHSKNSKAGEINWRSIDNETLCIKVP